MKNNLFKLISVAFFGSLIGKVLRYVIEIIIGRSLGPQALGIFATGIVIIGVGSVISRVGLDNTAKKYVPIYDRNQESGHLLGLVFLCLSIPFILGLIVSGLMTYILEAFGAGLGFDDIFALKMFIWGIPFYSVMMVGIAITRGFRHTKYAVYSRDIGQSLIALAGIIVIILSSQEIFGLAIAYIISIIFGMAIVIAFIRDLIRGEKGGGIVVEWKKWGAYSIPVFFVAVVNQVFSWTDILMLNVLMPSAAVGRYRAAFQMSAMLILLQHSANSIFPSIASDYFHSDQHYDLRMVYRTLTKWLIWAGILGGAFLFIFPEIILGIFGPRFSGLQSTLRVLVIGQFFAVGFGLAGPLLIMSGYERTELVNSTVCSVLNIVLNFVLILRFGIIGAAIATSISLGILATLRIGQSVYLLGINPISTDYWRSSIAAVASILVMVSVHETAMVSRHQVIAAAILSLLTFAIINYSIGLSEADKSLLSEIR